MKLTLSLDEETVARARGSAKALGQLVCEFLEQFGAKTDPVADAEFRRLSLDAKGSIARLEV